MIRPVLLRIARWALPVAMTLFFGMVVLAEAGGEPTAFLLLIPAGMAILTRGVLMLVRRDEVLHPLAEIESRGRIRSVGFQIENTYGALLFVAIGAGWIALGIAYGA